MNPLEIVISRIEKNLPYSPPKMEPLILVKHEFYDKKTKKTIEKSISIEPMALFNSLDSGRVSRILDDFTEKNDPKKIKEHVPQKISELTNKIKEEKLDDIDSHELLAVLFLASRERWTKVDLRKEQKSIEAVCDMLVGNSVGLNKGDGKSTTVIPIYSTIRALLHREDKANPSPALIVSASDESTLTELQNEIRAYKKKFFQLIEEDPHWGKISDKLVDCQIPDSSSNSILRDKPTDIFKFASGNGIKMLLLTHHQLVFETEKFQEMYGEFPPAVVDETHLLDVSPYYRSQGIKEVGSEPSELDAIDHFFGRLLVNSLETEKNLEKYFVFGSGQPELSEEGNKFVSRLTNNFSNLIRESRDLLKEISNKVGIPELRLIDQSLKIWDVFRKTAKKKEGGKKDFIASSLLSYVSILANIEKGRNVSEVEDVRDVNRGIDLPTHKFSTEARYWLRVMNKEILPGNEELISHYFYFASWLDTVVKGRLIGLSGSLFEPRLKGGIRESQIVKTLNNYSEGRVINLSKEQDPLSIPYVKISDTYNDLVQSILKEGIATLGAKQPQPHFIICWNDEMAEEMSLIFAKNGISTVAINKDTDRKSLNNTLRALSDGAFKVVITSGQGSYSQNIIDSFGNFPNLKISVINPMTEFNVTQGFSRKRAEKSIHDFNIFFDRANLLLLASYLPENKQKKLLDLLEKKKEVKKSFKTPELADVDSYVKGVEDGIRELVIDALAASQKSADYDSEIVNSQDMLFTKHIGLMIKEAKSKICNKEIIGNDRIKEEIEMLVLARFPKLKGKLLGSLVFGLQHSLSDYLSNIELSLYQEFIYDYFRFSVKYPTIEKQGRETYLVDLWKKKLRGKEKIWRHKLKDKTYISESTDAFVKGELDSIFPAMERIESFLNSPNGKKIKRSKVVSFQLVDLPFYPYDTEKEPKRKLDFQMGEAVLHHGQRIIAVMELKANGPNAFIGENTYYVTPPSLLEEPDERRYYSSLSDADSVYGERINELNPSVHLNFESGEKEDEVVNKAVFLPVAEDDIKGIVLIVEN